MSQDITLIGSFGIKPDSRLAFHDLVQALEDHIDEFNLIEIDDGNVVTLNIGDNTSVGSASKCEQLVANFIAEHGVPSAVVLQNGPDAMDFGVYGDYDPDNPKDPAALAAKRHYFTKKRDLWQRMIDNLET